MKILNFIGYIMIQLVITNNCYTMNSNCTPLHSNNDNMQDYLNKLYEEYGDKIIAFRQQLEFDGYDSDKALYDITTKLYKHNYCQ